MWLINLIRNRRMFCFLYLKRSIEVPVNSNSAFRCITYVLLNAGRWPSSDLAVVRERCTVIVVSIPQIDFWWSSASSSWSHNLLPHVFAAVDTCFSAMALNCTDELFNVLAVSWIVRSPSAASTGIGLNINPDHAIARFKQFSLIIKLIFSQWWRESTHKTADLRTCTLTSAREHINVYILDSSILSVTDILCSTWIESTVA